MKSSAKNVKLASVDDLFSTEESRQDADREKVVEIPLSDLHPFKGHQICRRSVEYMKFITKNMKYRNRNADGYNALLGTARAVKDKVLSDWFYPNHRENKWAQIYI